MAVDRQAAERAIHEFLTAVGHPPEGASELGDTPKRVAAAFLDELLSGYAVDIPELLAVGSEPAQQKGLVAVRDINVTTVCPHHLMPAVGLATVAYAPGGRLFGIGAIAKLVHSRSRRLTLQESIATAVAEDLVKSGARGAYCELTLKHSCLSARGRRQTEASVKCSARAGWFETKQGLAELDLFSRSFEGA